MSSLTRCLTSVSHAIIPNGGNISTHKVRINPGEMGIRDTFLAVQAPEFRVSIGCTDSNENGGTLRNWYFRYHLTIYASNRPGQRHEDILARPR